MYAMRKTGCIILVFRNIKYYLKSAANSFIRNGIATLASFITVSCCLFLFGIFLLFIMNLNFVSRQIEEQCEIQVYMTNESGNEALQNAYNKILGIENVLDATFETKDQAFLNFKEMLGESASVLDGLEGHDFLRGSIKVSLKNIRQADEVIKEIEKISGVAEIKNRQDIIRKVISFTEIIRNGSIIAILILLAIAVFIIQNTIKLSVYAREKELRIMKFVGATDRFIKMPFVLEGVMIGTLSFIVSFVLITLGYTPIISSLSQLIELFDFIALEECIHILGISMALFGIIMGAFGSSISVKRYLKV